MMNLSFNATYLPVTMLGNGSHKVAYLLNESFSNIAGWNYSQHENNTDDYNYHTPDHYTNNIYYDQKMHESFLSSIHRHSATFIGILACWTCFINIVLICACLASQRTKSDAFYLQVINFSVTNIVISVFVLPLTVYYILHVWELGQPLCRIWVIADILLPFVAFLIVLIISCDRLIHASHPKLYLWLFQKSLTKGIICTPWVIGLVIVVPIWTSGTVPFNEMTNQCVVIVTIEAAILCPVLTYFVPLAILGFLTFRMLLLRFQYASIQANVFETDRNTINNNHFELEETNTTPLHIPGDIETPNSNRVQKRIDRQDTDSSNERGGAVAKRKSSKIVAVCLVNLVNTVLWFPFQSISLLLSVCSFQSCIPSMALNQVFTLMGAASAGVVPLFWLFDTEIRENITKLCSRKQTTNLQESVYSDETFI
ncbi:5-hydroxytryptamine receptor 1D-like [Mya arenaria]|uniref:5-hydroxytryptamine receptor 1D-like n=1 Tax=Mya arenaria TaxID=6604 RepID=UPI0022DEA9DF|nr:5-hydroxytryptamine receptor 1D-like [Mya arenaria]XP_052792476.1 5-hydroxytryptamine receptor 1D-like [Mya arenaria]XP_052792477.1 5-hydroxytryptamine receptor 1D-like [Mya arenaria]XP_052792478.1 5-hydroxytryptamine receptor 1D-like [Mya arenaria]